MSAEKSDWEFIQDTIEKSESDFEQKLTYISAGTLVLSLTLIEKIIKIEDTTGVIFLIIGWSFLVLTLIINLISHLVSKNYLKISQKQISSKVKLEERISTIEINNKKIDALNIVTVVFLIMGIISIIIFSSINAMNRTNKSECNYKKVSISIPAELINNNDSIILINFTMCKEKNTQKPQEGENLNEGRNVPLPKENPDILKKGRTVPLPKESTPKPKEK